MKMQIELKKSELLALYDALESIKEKFNKNFTYSVASTKRSIKAEAESLMVGMEPSDAYSAYEKERNDLIKKYAAKDSDGKIITKNGGVRLDDEFVDECRNCIIEIEDKYKEVLDQREIDYVNFEKVLDEYIGIDVETIEWEFVPDTIEQSLMDALLPIITRGN